MNRLSMLRNRMAEFFCNSVKIESLSNFDESLLIVLESQSKLRSNWREVRLIMFIFVSPRLSGGACLGKPARLTQFNFVAAIAI